MTDNTLPPELAHRIKVERKRLDKSQDEIALLCGSSREMWGRYERGSYPMPPAVLRAFIDAGADSDFLRTGVRSDVLDGLSGTNQARPPDAVAKAIEVLQNALAGRQLAGERTVTVQLSEIEHDLILAYRAASNDRKEVFHDLVFAQKRRAVG